MTADPTTVLVIDDSALYRQSINNVLRELPHVRVVGTARNGVEALEKIEQLCPDLLTLDVQMPDMDGIQLLRELRRRRLHAKAIMVSSFTSAGARVTTEALMEGAFDFILKPSSGDSAANRQTLRDALELRISAFRESALRPAATLVDPFATPDDGLVRAPTPRSTCRVVVLGTSTGGPEALKAVLPKLPSTLSVPVLVVQHMPAKYTRSLAARLNELCPLHVCEASETMPARAGDVIFAPGGFQMQLRRRQGLQVRVTDGPREHGLRPSIDYLLHSVVDTVAGDALAVIMTGMGRDGLQGCTELKQRGGQVFAQSQNDAVVYGMPKVVVENNLADRVLPLGKIAPAITRHIKRSRHRSE